MAHHEPVIEERERLQLGYDFMTEDAIEHRELPFVMGIIGDFSGQMSSQKTSEENWQVREVTKDTFEGLLAQLSEGIELKLVQEPSTADYTADPHRERLVARWRHLYQLACQREAAAERVRIRLIDVSLQELHADLCKPFEESQLFYTLHENVYGVPGGEPYSIMLVDFEFSTSTADCNCLSRMSRLGNDVFCPFVAQAASAVDGKLQSGETQDDVSWRALRENEASGFLALMAPQVAGSTASDSLFEYAQIWLTRVIQFGWFWGVGTTQANATNADHQPGFIAAPFDQWGSTERTFYSPDEQTAEFRINSFHGRLPVMLSCSRFMQYFKVISRDSIGCFQEAREFEMFLMRWFDRYVGTDESEAEKLQRPLYSGKIEIDEHPQLSVRLRATLQPFVPNAPLPMPYVFETNLPWEAESRTI